MNANEFSVGDRLYRYILDPNEEDILQRVKVRVCNITAVRIGGARIDYMELIDKPEGQVYRKNNTLVKDIESRIWRSGRLYSVLMKTPDPTKAVTLMLDYVERKVDEFKAKCDIFEKEAAVMIDTLLSGEEPPEPDDETR